MGYRTRTRANIYMFVPFKYIFIKCLCNIICFIIYDTSIAYNYNFNILLTNLLTYTWFNLGSDISSVSSQWVFLFLFLSFKQC